MVMKVLENAVKLALSLWRLKDWKAHAKQSDHVMAFEGSTAPPMRMNPLWLCCGVLRVISAAPVNFDCEPISPSILRHLLTPICPALVGCHGEALKSKCCSARDAAPPTSC